MSSKRHSVTRHATTGWTLDGAAPFDAKTRIFIDTCSLMQEGIGVFLDGLRPLLRRHGLKLIAPVGVVRELNRLGEDGERREAAQRGVDALRRLEAEGLVDVRGEASDPFPDNLFQSLFTRYRTRYRLFLVTEDRGLVSDILRLNEAASVARIVGVHAVSVTREGVRPWVLNSGAADRTRPGAGEASSQAAKRRREGVAAEPAFKVVDRARPVDARPAFTGPAPELGATLTDGRGRRHTLEAELGSGGEGRVWATDTGLACKVYAPGRLTRGQVDKLRLMVSRPVDHPAICWPTQLVQDAQGEVVGYVMRRVAGVPLQLSVCMPQILETRMASWDRGRLAELASGVLRAIEVLHGHNVLLGDINPRNVLMRDARHIFVVDCDSFQLEGYACPVGTPAFLPPHLHGVELRAQLRSLEDELFAVATLMFVIVMAGKLPYAHTGGGELAENVRKQHFPYPLGERGSRNVPPGVWQYMWSHLPYYLKEGFHRVFDRGERVSVAEWQLSMVRYRNDVGKGYVTAEVFPKTFKQLPREQAEAQGAVWMSCPDCGEGFGAFEPWQRRCSTCHARARQAPLERCIVPPPVLPPPMVLPLAAPSGPSTAPRPVTGGTAVTRRPVAARRIVRPAPSPPAVVTPPGAVVAAAPPPQVPTLSLWEQIVRFFT